MNFKQVSLILFCSFLVTSCANYNKHFSHDSASWATKPLPTSAVYHSVILVGDAGEPTGNDEVYAAIKSDLEEIGKDGTIIFLGDNIYPHGMPNKDDSLKRKEAEEIITKQIDVVKNFEGKAVFIPGNHDWNKGRGDGLKSIKRQRNFIEDALDRKDVFLPGKGCPGPEELVINDDLVILFIDSQWYLQDWKKEPSINNKCEISSREEFIAQYADALKRHADRNVLVSLHHPLVTAGAHAGNFSIKSHIFPLTDLNPDLYIPLPVLGSIMPFYRKNFGNIQDINHPKYKEFITALGRASRVHKNVVFAAGHEHALQYFEIKGMHQIVSGSGSKKEPLRMRRGAKFLHSEKGYGRVDYHEDGQVWLHFYEPVNGSKPVFSVQMYRHESPDRLLAQEFAALPTASTSVVSSIEKDNKKSGFYQSLFGKHYRPLYDMPIAAPVLDLSKERGGLVPLKKGGGFQTRSLRLSDPDGKQFVLRAMKKDATKLLPEALRETFASEIVSGEFTTAHPYAAFAIPPMAKAVNVFHTSPKLVYVPKQQALGKYNVDLGDELYLYEERPAHDRREADNFGNSKDIVGTFDLIESMEKHANHRPDQRSVIRARLFDMVIGDWDRHDDQWRWASFKEDGQTIYRPIPRDRDQPFASYDGFLYKLIRTFVPDFRKWQEFEGDMNQGKWFNFNARYFDRFFINEMEWSDWEEEAKFIQSHLTDEVIENALTSEWDSKVFEFKGKDLLEIIKQRRNNLVSFADDHYRFISKSVSVVGTNDRDLYEVSYEQNGTIKVEVFELSKKGKKQKKYYSRDFDPAVSREIVLYALEGKDIIKFLNDGDSRIKIRIVGGPDKDLIESGDKTARLTKVYAYDRPKGMNWAGVKGVKDHRTNLVDYNEYNREDFKYNSSVPLILPGFNPDDGFNLTVGVSGVRNAFKKEPYSSAHSAAVSYYFGTSSLSFQYNGDFRRVLGNWGLDVGLILTNPTFNQNFFGLGNETLNPVREKEYNRVRRSLYGLNTRLFRQLTDETRFSIGPLVERFRVQKTEGRFVSSAQAGLPDETFGINSFLGYSAKFEHRHVNNAIKPNRGIDFEVELGRKHNINNSDNEFTFLKGSLALYHTFSLPLRPVLATRVGGGKNWGEFEFYQGHGLGGFSNLRGFRNQRFVGGSSFYHNSEIRIKLFEYNNYVLPTGLGLLFSYDYGRVWLENEESEKWHDSIGGGLWFSPVNTLVISTSLNHSSEEDRFIFKVGYFF